MRSNSHFRNRGSGPTFVCCTCDRRTRDAGQGVDHLCLQCFEIAGLDNQVNDSGADAPPPAVLAECEQLLKRIGELGGDTEKVKRFNEYIWRQKEEKA